MIQRNKGNRLNAPFERTFGSFCKTVIRYGTINLYGECGRDRKQYVSLTTAKEKSEM